MSPERWLQVKKVFDSAVELEPDQRETFLSSICADDSDLRSEVNSLLAANSDACSRFDSPAISADPLLGCQLGAYRILRRLGSGGMGAVYLASRADDQFRRLAAIKAIRPELLDDHTRRRFENERHTLAALDHPNIVRLLDGGTTQDGVPYLVMDYVEGQPVDVFCRERNLSIAERLELFRPLCAAVHYAHQNLVVHRDLKPANILVTPEGVPKLLDFGIAKLLRPSYAAATVGFTRTEAQPMTPEYASPEQILGQPITTASDIYSLGVLLYTLLTGAHPFQGRTHSSHELGMAICEGDPAKPSESAPTEIARQLRGDLDTIVLAAMRKEPQRRYASAEHLAEDLRRFLAGETVAARSDTWSYRARKFAGRHRVAMGTSAVALILLASLAVKDHVDGLRAERRFQDLRSFANFAIQDLDSAMRQGLTPARKTLSSKALVYLDGLAREAKSDTALQLEAVAGYLKVADLQGNLFLANMGDPMAARESVTKALAIAEELVRRDPHYEPSRNALAQCHERMGDQLFGTGHESAGALDHYRKALDLFKGDPLRTAVVFTKIAQIQSDAGDPGAALDSYRQCERAGQDWLARNPDNPAARNVIAMARERVAYYGMLAGEPAGAEEAVRGAIATYEAGNQTPRARRNVAMAYNTLAAVQTRAGDPQKALASCRHALSLSETLHDEDPKNNQYGIDIAQEKVLLIDLLLATGQRAEARKAAALTIEQLKTPAHDPHPSIYYLVDYLKLLEDTPFVELRAGENTLALAQKAVDMTRDTETLDLLAKAYRQAGQMEAAIATEKAAIALLPPLAPGRPAPEIRVKLNATLASFAQASGDQRERN